MPPRTLLVATLIVVLASKPLAQTVVRDLIADPPSGFYGDNFGSSLVGTADLDGDLVPDLLVGAPFDDDGGHDAGMVRAYSGRTGATLWTRFGPSGDALFGHGLCSLSDVDGDGRADLAVGAFGEYAPSHDTGTVRVLSGTSGATLYTLTGTAVNEQFGYRVARVRDQNGDGRDDLAISALVSVGASSFVRLCSGVNGATLWTRTNVVADVLSDAGDVDGDGVNDVLAANQYSGPTGPGGYARGEAQILSGANGAQIWLQNGTGLAFQFGVSGCSVGDLDGDGKAEVAIGTGLDDTAAPSAGSVRIFSPAHGTEIRALFPTSSPGNLTYYYGASLANLGDLDGDLWPEIAIGSGDDATGFGCGRMDVRRTSDGGLLWSSIGTQDYDGLGGTVASLGDLNGDGIPDVAATSVSSLGPSPGGYVRIHLSGWSAPTNYCTAKTNSQGCVPQTSFEGTMSLSLSTIALRVTNVLALQPGQLFLGRSAASVPFAGGTLCVGGALMRTGMQAAGGSTTCSGGYAYTLTPSFLAFWGIAPGTTLYGQFWSRDPGFVAPNHVGLSDAISFPVCP